MKIGKMANGAGISNERKVPESANFWNFDNFPN